MAKNVLVEIDSLRRTVVRLLDRTLGTVADIRNRILSLHEEQRGVLQDIAFVESGLRDLGIVVPTESSGGLIAAAADQERAVVNLGSGHEESARGMRLTPKPTRNARSLRTIESDLCPFCRSGVLTIQEPRGDGTETAVRICDNSECGYRQVPHQERETDPFLRKASEIEARGRRASMRARAQMARVRRTLAKRKNPKT